MEVLIVEVKLRNPEMDDSVIDGRGRRRSPTDQKVTHEGDLFWK